MTAPSRPVLRYHGGKWRLAPWLLSFFPPHRVYVEPFGGAASVLMRKPRCFADVYNDLDGDVVNVFRVLRDPEAAAELRRIVELTPFARAEFTLAYEEATDPVERARRTVVRAFMGFGSSSQNAGHATGFRANGNRNGVHPASDWVSWPRQIERFVERLAGVVVEERDALECIAQHDREDTLVYADPPYVLATRGCARGVRQKYRRELNDDDHRLLATVLRGVRGMVVLSGYPSALYDVELFPDWERHERRAFTDNGGTGAAVSRTEVVWLNPACSAALRRSRDQQHLELGAG